MSKASLKSKYRYDDWYQKYWGDASICTNCSLLLSEMLFG